MKNKLTPEFVSRVLKLSNEYEARYSVEYINIEIIHKDTRKITFINIHEFIHTHCCDYLISYANGLSELLLFINAVEWLIKYREDNPKLSKFWVNKL